MNSTFSCKRHLPKVTQWCGLSDNRKWINETYQTVKSKYNTFTKKWFFCRSTQSWWPQSSSAASWAAGWCGGSSRVMLCKMPSLSVLRAKRWNSDELIWRLSSLTFHPSLIICQIPSSHQMPISWRMFMGNIILALRDLCWWDKKVKSPTAN